ncbi:leucine-rich repeat-containing protein kinase family protein [Scleromatobacter humisilvae]|uniref:Leucine-rich repeat-containing serine/threonine-protein kinase n=1 Tax=Scleromatobacter humisilvae TaxID=2897159 RepID=A0A9X1YL94_9BURK|nr:leucine-rich repeat-containing protein kinase family protein [Scleromatobacter humisilvae]MCK9687807.1 leucine-rich repeat-containing serine/threonine-protein kinase [Scleromatobacter humisilvae]
MTANLTTLADLRAGRLAGATHLDLRHGGLDEFPREIFALADTLTMLDLSSNRLRALPDDLPRLHALRTLFCSNNRFETLPASLGACPALDLVGFKANAIAHVPASSLSPRLRWLILSDNRVEAMPGTLGACRGLRKLALAGNRLTALPVGIANCEALELIRLSANAFARIEDALPDGLLALPRLSWLAVAGNPFNVDQETRALAATPIARIDWSELQLGELLGEGASGHIWSARWRPAQGEDRLVAVKLFKGAMTSDGLPGSEMAACIAADVHAHVIGVEGRIAGHPQDAQGLVMGLIPPRYRSLAGPPSLASCTRDVYAPGLRFTGAHARSIARGARDALVHLHAQGLMHGDFYAHNLLVDDDAHALLGDFGAASFLPEDDDARAEALRRIDRRSLGVLVDELAQRCDDPGALADLRP